MNRRQRCACALVVIGLAIGLATGPAAQGAHITWRGVSGSDWQEVNNWDPISLMPVIWRVPTDGDTAEISDTTNGTSVTLSDDTDEIDGLTVLNGFVLETSGYLLHVSDGGNSLTTIGASSWVKVDELTSDPSDRAFDADFVEIDGGNLRLNGGIAEIDRNAEVLAGTNGFIRGWGTVKFGRDLDPLGTEVLTLQDGNIRVTHSVPGATLTLKAHKPGLELNLGTGRLDVNDDAGLSPGNQTLIIDSALTDSFRGMLEIGEGDTANFTHAWSTFSADVEFDGGITGVATLTGAYLTVDTPIGFGNSTFTVASGTAVVENDLKANRGTFNVDATLQLDGAATFENAADLDLNNFKELIINGVTEVNQNMINLDGAEVRLTDTITINNSALLTLNVDYIDNTMLPQSFDDIMNINGGTLEANVTGGWISDGTITLQDGVFTGTHLTNNGQIEGYGTVTTSGLDNESTIAAKGAGRSSWTIRRHSWISTVGAATAKSMPSRATSKSSPAMVRSVVRSLSSPVTKSLSTAGSPWMRLRTPACSP